MIAQAFPIWALRTLGGLLALLLVVMTVGAALLVPYIPELADAAARLPDATTVVERAPSTLDQVERIDRNVQDLTPQVLDATGDLSLVAPKIAKLSRQVDILLRDLTTLQGSADALGRAAPNIARLSGQLVGLQASLRGLDARLADLGSVGEPLRELAKTTGPLPTSLDRLNRSTAVLDELPGRFDALQRILIQVARHVRNLDRKTGPTLR